jgi:DNA-binding LacI/PurR family transcriptional regulator
MKRPVKAMRRSAAKVRRMDIRAVAKLAEVSAATVSRTINHIPTVNPVLARRVWDAIRELDYHPNSQARGLVSGRSRLLGLIVSEITNPFFPELVRGFEDAAVERGYDILIGSTNSEPERMQRCIRRIVERNVEGVAIMTFGIEQPLLDQLVGRSIPLVFIDVAPERPSISVLRIDYYRGILQGVQHLAKLGHSRIAFIAGPVHLHSAQSRLKAFELALEECRIPIERRLILEGHHTMEGGAAATERLLSRFPLPRAIMCSNDMEAIGVLHMLSRRDVRVPSDVSVIGFDDIYLAEVMMPPLTSIKLSRLELARTAVAALRAHVEKASPQRDYEVGTQLVVRDSTDFNNTETTSSISCTADQ